MDETREFDQTLLLFRCRVSFRKIGRLVFLPVIAKVAKRTERARLDQEAFRGAVNTLEKSLIDLFDHEVQTEILVIRFAIHGQVDFRPTGSRSRHARFSEQLVR